MTGFSVNPNPQTYGEIENTFWPKVSINDFATKQRIGGSIIPEAQMRDALISSIIHVEDELINKLAEWQIGGNSSLENVDAPIFGGESKLVFLWRTAIYTLAAAKLIETRSDISTTNDGLTGANAIIPTADQLRAQSLDAIRKIKGGQSGIARSI